MAISRLNKQDGNSPGKTSGLNKNTSRPHDKSSENLTLRDDAVAFETLLENHQLPDQSQNHQRGKRNSAEVLFETLKQSEQKLIENPSYPKFVEYKNYLKELLDKIFSEGFQQKTIAHKNREYNIVVRINQQTAQLLDEVQKNKSETARILELMGQINGYILDLMC